MFRTDKQCDPVCKEDRPLAKAKPSALREWERRALAVERNAWEPRDDIVWELRGGWGMGRKRVLTKQLDW